MENQQNKINIIKLKNNNLYINWINCKFISQDAQHILGLGNYDVCNIILRREEFQKKVATTRKGSNVMDTYSGKTLKALLLKVMPKLLKGLVKPGIKSANN